MFDWLRKNVGRLVRLDSGSGGVGVGVWMGQTGRRFLLISDDALVFQVTLGI